jgi:amino acid adenylation domain-containing protein
MTTKANTGTDDIALRIADLSPDKRQFFEMLLKKDGVNLSNIRIVPQRRGAENLPLSFAQKRLWFLYQLDPASVAYNVPLSVRMVGQLDVFALRRAFNEIFRRHEVLRTCYRSIDGQPAQVINPNLSAELPVIELRHLSASEQESEVARLAAQQVRTPFDLSQAPLLRVALLRLSQDEHVLLLTVHHIVCDGWSVGILIKEVVALYGAYHSGELSPLADLQIQYADYAYWQTKWMGGLELEEHLDYWKQQLEDAPSLIELPCDRPRATAQKFRGARYRLDLDDALSGKIFALMQSQEVTLFMTLVAAFAVLLHRYSGEEDILIGTPSANRNRAELEDLIGFFVNNLVLRVDLSGDPSFDELLRRIKKVALGSYAHQDMPFERLVEELQPDRSLSHAPLFQVMFTLQNTPGEALELPGLNLSAVWVEPEISAYDMTLVLEDAEGRIGGFLEYNRDLFNDSTISRMVSHYQRLLEAAARDSSQKISRLGMLTDQEKHQALNEWNDTDAPYPDEICVNELIEAQVARAPESVAVRRQEQHITYGELNGRANQFGHFLRAEGVGPETLIGICVERSIEMVIALLGIMKSGGGYVPLDPAYPVDRLRFMVEDADLKFIITDRQTSDSLPAFSGRRIELDLQSEAITSQSAKNLQSGAGPSSVAYVIYTSGSTGRPKGTLVEHRGLCNLAEAQVRAFNLKAGSHVLQFASLSFDASIFEIIMALRSGSTLYVGNQQTMLPGSGLFELMSGEAITNITIPPSVLGLLEGSEALTDLESVIVAGEACPAEIVERWAEGRRFFNAYGPTEATVWATVERCSPSESSPAIGMPIDNTQALILSRGLEAMPQRARGEIHISGVGLARGYLNRPDLTAEKFIPNPFGKSAGARLYKTGDLASYREDGKIDYIGRADQQVKVRGARVEMGEIEDVFRKHEAISDVAVDIVKDDKGQNQLAAYVVLKPEASLSASELRQAARSKLPDFMTPQRIIKLDAIPLTVNGKVDRQALSVALKSAGHESEKAETQLTPIEEMLAGVWAETLKLAKVSKRDNFFDLGGHSLLATQVISRINEAYAVEIPLRALFEEPTLAGLAERIESHLRMEKGLQSPPIMRYPRQARVPLSHAQQRLWFFDKLVPGNPFYNIPAAVRLTGDLDEQALERSIAEVIRRHEVLRTTFDDVGGEPAQVISPAGTFLLAKASLDELDSVARDKEVLRLTREEARRSFDLRSGPLLRATLLRLSAQEHILMLTIHHIVADGWSIGIFVKETATLYDAFRAGKASRLPEPAIQYADYAEWQQRYLQGETLDAELAYWKRQLEGIPPALNLPVDYPRPSLQSFQGRRHPLTISGELSGRLKSICREENATLYMALLGALNVLLSRYSGQTDIVVGSAIAGRNRAQIEGLIGFFTNTIVLRARLSGDMTFREALRQVRQTCLDAYMHQDMPFEKLVEALRPERDLSRTPIVQAGFALQNAPMPALELGDLAIELIDSDTDTAKTDLSFSLSETDKGIAGSIEYSTDLFSADTIAVIEKDFQTLLESITDNLDQPISSYPPLSLRPATAAAPLHLHEAAYDRSNLTRDQLIIWMGQKLQPNAPLYSNSLSYRLHFPVDRAHFQRAFQVLINSSDAMRMVFREVDGIPVRETLAEMQHTIEYFDFSQMSDPSAEFSEWARERSQIIFDLSERLMYVALVKMSDDIYEWYINQHHLVADGWAYTVMLDVLSDLYEKSLRGELEERVDLPQFEDYITFDRSGHNTERYRKAEAYWDEKLSQNCDPILFFKKSGAKQTTQLNRATYKLEDARTQRMKELARQEGVFSRTLDFTLLNIYLTILFAYLYRISGNRVIAIGCPYHNRRAPFKETIGEMMEVIVVQVAVDDNESFLSLFKKVREDLLKSLRHTPFAISNPHNRKAYDVLLNYHNERMIEFAGAPVILSWIWPCHGNNSLMFQVTDFGLSGTQTLDFDFHSEVFNEDEQARSVAHLLNAMDSFLEKPQSLISNFSLLSEEEERRVLLEFNDTCCRIDREGNIVEVFERQVEATPDRVAAVFCDESLSYEELNKRANKTAHRLRALGACPEEIVALSMERSLDVVIGVFGILKTGAAYTPLAPELPRERLDYMLNDSQSRLVLTQSHLSERFASGAAEIVRIDSDEIKSCGVNNPPNEATAENIAYVIYTSGSTGRPKGVMVSHRNLVNAMAAWEIEYNLSRKPVVSIQTASLSFDVGAGDVIRTLCAGGKLALCSQETLLDQEKLIELMLRERITHSEWTPAFTRTLAEYLERTGQKLDFMELIVFGADLSRMKDLYAAQRMTSPQTKVYNSYGVTEATIDTTYFEGSTVELQPDDVAPIGHAMANMQIYMLDQFLRPVPVGIPGELCIGGEALARGYVGRAELTAERFIPNPFSSVKGERIYRTGDAARFLPDGNVDFMGRRDQQVKIRGYRIELEEIEAALHQHPHIKQALVVCRTVHQQDKELAAFLVRGEQQVTSEEVREHLSERLPRYMIPTAIAWIEQLPVTANGKVDRKWMPETESLQRVGQSQYVEPETEVEQEIAKVWEAVLKVEKVGLYDNFFDLGGHSLLVIQAHSKMREEKKWEISIIDLFNYPTVSQLAKHVRKQEDEEGEKKQGQERGESRRRSRLRRQSGQQKADGKQQAAITIGER